MLPVNTNNAIKPKDGCTPVSSSCVVWNGPDIPCINLCKGDSIELVVYNLAMLLCEITEGVIDVTTLEFKCLVEEGQEDPATLLETIQLLIDKVCNIEENCCDDGTGGVTPGNPSPIALPECLYYTEDGDEITQLLPADYSRFLAEHICDILATTTSLQSALSALTVRVTTLENTVATGGGGGAAGEITVQTQCASGTTPGLTLPIQTAFYNFENKFCQLQTLLGSNTALSTAIGKECANLDSATQLSNPDDTMSDLSGWVANPTNLSQTIVNMWLTLCDMRSAISSAGSSTPDCALIPPFNVQLINLTTTGCTVKWNAPPYGSFEAPSGYTVQVKEWNGTAAVGPAVATVTKTHPTLEHTFSVLGQAGKTYIVEVEANYSCGSSLPATTIGFVRISAINQLIKVTDITTTNTPLFTCDTTQYPAVENMTTVKLVDPVTGADKINTGATITVTLRYSITGDCPIAPTQDVTISILSGQSSGTYTYIAERYRKCGSDPCTPEYKTLNCGVSISNTNTAFDSSIATC